MGRGRPRKRTEEEDIQSMSSNIKRKEVNMGEDGIKVTYHYNAGDYFPTYITVDYPNKLEVEHNRKRYDK
jgi:hypothetical protein